MSKLYKISISDDEFDEIVIDNEIDEMRFLAHVPEEAIREIDSLLDIYDYGAMGGFRRIFSKQGPSLAWAYVFLDREYAVARIARETLGDCSRIAFGHYSTLFDPKCPNREHSVGYISVADKAALAEVAQKSRLWAECWRALSKASASQHWITILDPLPESWVEEHENPNIVNVWQEMKKLETAQMKPKAGERVIIAGFKPGIGKTKEEK